MERYINELWVLVDIALAAVLGFLIGFERKKRFKEAGIRTHTIVCIGAALMMAVSKYAFDGQTADAARVAAQIVSGVGFLGAGMIVYRQHNVYGLTTAAGVWATAGVGMACGGRLYIVAAGGALVLIGIQCLLHLRLFQSHKYYSLKIKFRQAENANERVKEIFSVTRFNHLVINRENGHTVYSATLNTDREFSSSTLEKILEENDFITSIERCDDM
ncbi:MAG: MgtC/SapB family protein [Clostridia bacterium]|nr:MgtC/SapB family protein [Clostridia bacterium]